MTSTSINHLHIRSLILLNSITSSTTYSNVETCDGLSNLARALIGLAFCTSHTVSSYQPTSSQISPAATPITSYIYYLLTLIFPRSEFGPSPSPHHNQSTSPHFPGHTLYLVRISQTTRPPGQSSLRPPSSAGRRRGGLWRSTAVRAAVSTSHAQWP